jgi:hypothetical protein
MACSVEWIEHGPTMTSTRSSWLWMIEAAVWRAREIVKRDSFEGWISAREVGRLHQYQLGNSCWSSMVVDGRRWSSMLTGFDEGGLCERVVAAHPAVVDVEELLVRG